MTKKKPIEQSAESVDQSEPEKIIVSLYTSYVVCLQAEFGGHKKGTKLEAILLPTVIDRKNDKWENRWFVYEGERFIGNLPKETDVMTLVAIKKGKK